MSDHLTGGSLESDAVIALLLKTTRGNSLDLGETRG